MNFPNFCGPSYSATSPMADVEHTINWYPEGMEVPGAKARVILVPAEGYRKFLTVDHFPIRGMFAQNDRAFVVADNILYEIFANKTAIARGSSLTNDGAPVTIVSNGSGGHQLFLTGNSKGFLYDLNTNILTNPLASANFASFLSGFFVVLDVVANTIRVSNAEDGSVWDPLQVAQRTLAGDTMKALAATKSDLWIFGSQTSEVWYPQGGSFPLTPKLGAFLTHGIGAAYSVAIVDNAPMWLEANDQGQGIVMRAGDGYAAQRVSTHALEKAIQGYSAISDAIGWSYQIRGHSFYVLTFPTAKITWVYDAAASAQLGFPCWHQRGYWSGAAFDRMKGQFHCFAFGRHLIGDHDSGDIYELDPTSAMSEDGVTGIRRVRVAPHIPTEKKQLFIRAFELDTDVGVGLAAGQGSDPQMMMRLSKDGMKTWGGERMTTIGALGAYNTRVRWNALGAARKPVFEVSMSDPVLVSIIGASLDATIGLS